MGEHCTFESQASASEVGQYRDRIQRYVRSLTRGAADSEELTQETFLRAYGNLSSLRDRKALGAWLYRIATNVVTDWLRRQTHTAMRVETGESGSPETLADSRTESLQVMVEQKEMSDCVQTYLEQLNDGQRAVLILHDVEGMTVPEISELLGITCGAAKIRLHRARRFLREALDVGCRFSHDRRGVLVCEPQLESKTRPGTS